MQHYVSDIDSPYVGRQAASAPSPGTFGRRQRHRRYVSDFDEIRVVTPFGPLGNNYVLTADSSAFTLTGQPAGLAFNRRLAADSGAFTLTGQDATLTYSASGLPTVGRPISDTSNTGWLASAGGPLFAMIDEVVTDDSDYIYTASATSVCQMALNATAYPGTASQAFQFRASSAFGNTVQARLRNADNSIVATWSQVLTATPTTYAKVLTAGEIALITSGSLSLELTAL